MAKVGFAAVGVGGRLTGLLKSLLDRHGDVCELKALSDDSPEALAAAREAFGTGVPAFEDHRRALEVPGVDWVLVGSKNYLHRDHCVDAFAAGRHVFCEKPLAISLDQCEDIGRAHRDAGTLLAMGFVLRYARLYRQIVERIRRGDLGRVITMEVNENLRPGHGGYIMQNWRRHRRLSGPHVLEKCCHDIDLMNWMVESVPSRVASFGGLDIFIPKNKPMAEKLSKGNQSGDLFRLWPVWEDVDPFGSDKDVEDNQVSILEYRNGVRASFHTNCCTAFGGQRRMLICGLEGTLEADLISGLGRFQRIGAKGSPEAIEVGARGGHGGADDLIVDDLAHSMATGAEPRASIREGLCSAVAALAIDKAMREGRVVDVEPIWRRFGV